MIIPKKRRKKDSKYFYFTEYKITKLQLCLIYVYYNFIFNFNILLIFN